MYYGGVLLKSNLEGTDLTYCEFLLTHHMKRGMRKICSFRGMASALVVLESRYHKVSDWTAKFFSWPVKVGIPNGIDFSG